MKSSKLSVVLLALLLGGSLAANAQIIGVQFWTNSEEPTDAPLTSGQTAGVVSQDNFNAIDVGTLPNLSGTEGTFSLVNSTGAASGVTLTVANNSNAYYTETGTSTANATLLSGQSGDYSTGPATYTFTGVAPGAYDLIAYTVTNGADQNAEVSLTTGATSGPSNLYDIEQFGADFTGTFIPGTATSEGASTVANYVEFAEVSPVGGTIEISLPNLGVEPYDDALNGFQLVAVPEPSTVVLMGIGAVLLLGAALRRFPALR